jgi:hypothetical protein
MSLRPGIGSNIRRQFVPGLGWYGLRGLGDSSVVPTGSIDTGGTQVDTGGTQQPGGTANPVMTVVGTNTQILSSSGPTILSTGVAPVGATPQSPLPVQGTSTLVVSDGGFLPPQTPAMPAPKPSFIATKGGLALGLGLLAIAAYAWYGNKGVKN